MSSTYEKLNAVWKTRRTNFRNIRSINFSTTGRGLPWLRLWKIKDNFVVGTPILPIDTELPFRPKICLICTPKKLYTPARISITKNRLFAGLHLPLQQFNHSNCNLYDYGIMGHQGMLVGDVVFDFHRIQQLSPVIPNPVLKICNPDLMEQGMQAFRLLLKRLHVYRDRHHILPWSSTGIWHIKRLWTPKILWQVSNGEISSPLDFKNAFSREITFFAPSIAQFRRLWIIEGYKHGFAQVVPKNGEYVAPAMKIDYTELIRGKND